MFEIELEELNEVFGVDDREELAYLSQKVLSVGNGIRTLGIDKIEMIREYEND